MKTAEEKAEIWLNDNVDGWDDVQFQSLIELLEKQDRDTRHACAEAVVRCGDADYFSRGSIWKADAEMACMNVKAV